jgi:hypothetical protein
MVNESHDRVTDPVCGMTFRVARRRAECEPDTDSHCACILSEHPPRLRR